MKSQPLFEDSADRAPSETDINRDGSRAPRSESAKFSSKDERQEFFLPVTGFVWLYPEEVAVVDHPAFQRLGNIYQLGQTYLVYRGATHRRIEHVLGALHIVQRMIEAVGHNSAKAKSRDAHGGAPLSPHEERFIRLGALLHDIGHVTAGHTLEDELGLIGKHDEDGRLDRIFNGVQWFDRHERTLGQLIDYEFKKYIPSSLAREGVTASEILRLLIRKPPKGDSDKYAAAQKKLQANADIRLQVCCNMIGNTICADLLDYLHRDWYHVGKPRPFDERILQYMEIRTKRDSLEAAPGKSKATDTFVISLGKRPKIRTDAVSAILELLEWRYQLAESVLFHRTKLAATAMLDRALYELWSERDPGEIEEIVLPLGDDQLISETQRIAHDVGSEQTKVAESLLAALQRRELYTTLSTFTHDDLPADVRTAVRGKYSSAETRARMLMLLEADFGLPTGSLAMYCPSQEAMNAKIAKVRIAIGAEEDQFDQYERTHENQLSGGHLEAQLHRFRRLWRVHFFINRTVKLHMSAEMIHSLRQAIEKLALGNIHEDDCIQAAHGLASQLAALPTSPWLNRAVRSEPLAAAYQDAAVSYGAYPFGAPAIRSYLEPEGGAKGEK